MSESSSSSTIFCASQRARAVGGDFHAVLGIAAAGRREHALALDLDHAGAAVAVRPHALLVAKVRNLDAVCLAVSMMVSSERPTTALAVELELDRASVCHLVPVPVCASMRALLCAHHGTDFVRKVFHHDQDGVRRRLPQAADRGVHHRLRTVPSATAGPTVGFSISVSALAVPTRQGVHWPQDSSEKNLDQVPRRVGRAVLVGEDDDRRRADEAAVLVERVEVERDVAHRRRAGSRPRRRRADSRRTGVRRRMPPQYSAISSFTVMPAGARCTPGFFTRPHTENERRPLRPLRPCADEPGRALFEDVAHPVQRLHVVLERGPAEQAHLRDVRRAQARHAALALDRFDHRRFFAADIGARAAAQVDGRQRAGRIRPSARPAPSRGSRGSRGTRRAGRCRSRRCRPPTPRSACPRGSGADRARGSSGP